MCLCDVDDDTLIQIFSFLPVHSILTMRQTCRRMMILSCTRVIWRNAYVAQVLAAGLPFPHRRLADMDGVQLEHAVKRALRIGRFWRSDCLQPKKVVDFYASSGTGVSDVRFLPGYDGRRLATLSKGIWSVITCWETSASVGVRKIAEWCPKGTIVTGLVVNSDAHSDAVIATALNGPRRCIEILSLSEGDNGDCVMLSLGTINSTLRPIALQGDLLAYSDDSSRTVITNWKTGAVALLQGADEPVDQHFQVSATYNRCLQIVFTHASILVVRARSIELFPAPVLQPPDQSRSAYRPLAYHSFGWVDGVSVNVQTREGAPNGTVQPLSVLLRTESDDPWMADTHTLNLYVLEPNPLFMGNPDDPTADAALESSATSANSSDGCPHRTPAPYRFPPVHSTLSSPSVRGFLRCTDIALGPCGTAVWIQPRPARSVDLTTLDVHASETQGPRPGAEMEALAGMAFTGPLRRGMVHTGSATRSRTIHARESATGGNWTAMDYVEELGMVALASTHGAVTVLELG